MKRLFGFGARFGATSVLCALLNMAILIGGDAAHWHYAASTTASFVACVLTGYWLHCRFTFVQPLSLAGLARYTAAMAFNFPLLFGSVWLFHDRAGLSMFWVAPLSTVIGFCYNFLASRWAIHRRLAGHD
jgi:putative flippase GtrA